MYGTRRLAIGLAAVWACACHPEHREEDEHEHEKATFSVTTPLREEAEIETEYVAQVRAIQHIELRALERGYLTSIHVDEGQLVEKGLRTSAW